MALEIESPPVYKVAFGGQTIDTLNIESVRWEMDINQHEYGVVRLRSFEPTRLDDLADVPMRIEMGFEHLGTKVKVGYLSFATVEHLQATGESRSRIPAVELHVFGATVVMQSGTQRIWYERNAASVAAELLAGNRMGADVDAHDHVWPLLAQTHESDGSMVVSLAKRIGYHVVADNTTVHFVDPAKAVTHVLSPVPSYRLSENGVPNTYAFEPTYGMRNPEVDNVGLQRSYLDSKGEVQTVLQGRLLTGLGRTPMGFSATRAGTDTPVDSYEEAALANRAQSVENLWTYTATLTMPGDPWLTPGAVVEVSTPIANYSGLWYVRSVRHAVGSKNFITTAELGKDATGTPLRLGGGLRDWRAETSSRLHEGRWVATWAA